ncbi:MAG: beta-ketoacyl-ACP synthase III [Sedimentisphaeraceae bacterium JB056]
MADTGDKTFGKWSAVIAGTGSALPEKLLTNDDLAQIVDTNDEWITARTGIKQRHIASDEETTVTLATDASRKALEAAGVDASDVDMIIVGTITPEMVFPATACFVQKELGASKASAFDVTAACSGFLYALSIGTEFIRSGNYKNILVIGAETLSRITNYKDRGSCILFGDGAGAVVLQRSEKPNTGVLCNKLGSDGNGWTSLNCQAYGSRYPADKPLEDESMMYMHINGREVYQLAVRSIVETVQGCLDEASLTASDIKKFIPHQMNARIIESVAKRMDFTDEQIFINIDKIGNTSAASIPIALDECYRAGEIQPGDAIVLVAFGAGLTWGGSVIRF